MERGRSVGQWQRLQNSKPGQNAIDDLNGVGVDRPLRRAMLVQSASLTLKNDSDQRITCYLPRANMKQTFSVVVGLVVSLICLSVVKAGDVRVKVRMTTGPQDPPTTTFASNTPKLYAIFKTEGAKTGDKIRGVLIAEDVGDVAPANTKVLETILDIEGDTDAGDFNFNKPTNDWPVGKYRMEIYVNDEHATTAKFTIKAASSKKHADEEEEESSGD